MGSCAEQKRMKITLKKKLVMHMFSLRLCVSFTSFSFVKNIYFISKISFYLAKSCIFAPWKKSMKITLEKKISNACLIPAPVRLILSTLLKIWISFKKYQSKILRSCVAQKCIKMTLEKNSVRHVLSLRLCV